MQHVPHVHGDQRAESADGEGSGRDRQDYEADHRMAKNEAHAGEQVAHHRFDLPVGVGRPRGDGDGGDHQAGEHKAGAIQVVTGTGSGPPRQRAGQDGAANLQDLHGLLDQRVGAHQPVERHDLRQGYRARGGEEAGEGAEGQEHDVDVPGGAREDQPEHQHGAGDVAGHHGAPGMPAIHEYAGHGSHEGQGQQEEDGHQGDGPRGGVHAKGHFAEDGV